jgi:hypothetical protein
MVQEFEGVRFNPDKPDYQIPALRYDFFRYILAFDHFYGELYLIENQYHSNENTLNQIFSIISRQDHQTYPFSISGDEKSNMALSEARAKAVYEYLAGRGITAERMSYKGFGETQPIADNATAVGRKQNRRTEFSITKM